VGIWHDSYSGLKVGMAFFFSKPVFPLTSLAVHRIKGSSRILRDRRWAKCRVATN
jgi:hypothetical protein